MRELTITAALLFVVACASMQAPGLLVVRVVDERCGDPLPGATVTVTKGSQTESRTTDVHGDAEFFVARGVWRVVPSLPGSFDAQVATAGIESSKQVRLEVWLNLVRPGSMVVEPHGPCRPRVTRTSSAATGTVALLYGAAVTRG